MKKLLLTLLAFVALGVSQLSANKATEPVVHSFAFEDNAIVRKLSDNGMWAVAHGVNPADASFSINPRLVNLKDKSSVLLTEGVDPATIISAAAVDATDDGSIVVGEYNKMPGYWKTATKTWVELPLKAGNNGGKVLSVTPDGKYAVGLLTFEEDLYTESEALWDLTTGKLIQTEGLPQKDMAHDNHNQNRFIDISADGNTILGCMSFSYLPSGDNAGGLCYYLYDVKGKSYKMIGFTPDDKEPWTPEVEGLFLIDAASISPNGKWVTGIAQLTKKMEDSDFLAEYAAPCVYDVDKKQFSILDDSENNGMIGCAITNDGTLLGATPQYNPFREWSIRSGNYWYPIRMVLKQKYGIDILAASGQSNTGTPISICNDNRNIAVMTTPQTSYLLTLPEDISHICENLNLLGNYTAEPLAGSELSTLKRVKINFDRNIELLGDTNCVEIQDKNGKKIYASSEIAISGRGKALSINFEDGTLQAGEEYTVVLPAGSICLEGDQAKKNEEIRIAYTGRANTPVAMVKAVPENHASIAKLDATSNPIVLTFDTNVQFSGKAVAQLFRTGEEVAFCELSMGYSGKEVTLYPTNTQILYKDANYKVVIPAGCITDVTGNNANEEIVLEYVGAYEREISSDDKMLFSDNFDQGLNNFLLFDGDRNEASEEMKNWGFKDAINYPWSIVRDDETKSDMAAASHSMYTPAGKSYDWMIIPQTYIPDNLCTLKFQSQSYKKDAKDVLKVIVWTSNNIYNVLNKNIIDQIYKEGKVVYEEVQTPGAHSELLEGEWTDNTVDLREFAGKNVYIAFLNENEAQSVIFLNNVEVVHNIPFLVTLDNENKVIAKSDITVKGRITVDTEEEIYQSVALTLKDAAGKTIDTLTESGLQLKKGDTYHFTFGKALPLNVGKQNDFSIDLKLNNTENTVRSSVKNLSFAPTKRVVLEEYTGMNCPKCPLGILAIEKIKSIYGEQFLPIALHSFPGDQLGAGIEGYSAYLNFSGAPTAMIQRSGTISNPMVSKGPDYSFSDANGEKLWLDLVQEEMATSADAEIRATLQADTVNKTLEIPCTVRYAMDTKDLNINLFTVILEDDVIGFQQNNLSGVNDPDLGDFGVNGKYAQTAIYPFYHQHVARSWFGNTLAGTGGLLPTQVEAGKDYTANISMNIPENIKDLKKMSAVVMMIDANTGRVINAVEVHPDNITGIESDNTTLNVQVSSRYGQVIVNTAQEARVTVYTTAGKQLGTTEGMGSLSINANGYRGVALVKVVTPMKTIVKKVMF